MISITKLLTDSGHYGDKLRYTENAGFAQNGVSCGAGPVVVWNVTRKCNLNCVHCYSLSEMKDYENEMSYGEGLKFIDSLADFNVPVLLFSGGEPLLRDDLFPLLAYAKNKGIRTAVSTNGTLIDFQTAKKLKETGVSYVGISIDGASGTNDKFRGLPGAFEKAASGIRNCVSAGQRVGVRFTVTKYNADSIPYIFDFIEDEGIDRACFFGVNAHRRFETVALIIGL
jgi:MoaA/NifB/PqqE/SkfB family radical SAM enzyme